VFLDIGERFRAYTQYYTNHGQAGALLQALQGEPHVLAMLLSCQMLLGHQLPLADYLLKPVQRFLKYPLLLQVSAGGSRITVILGDSKTYSMHSIAFNEGRSTYTNFQGLLKATSEDSEGYAELVQAHGLIKTIARQINEVGFVASFSAALCVVCFVYFGCFCGNYIRFLAYRERKIVN
jgi:hypothetical protein